jgi:hypothetical protein
MRECRGSQQAADIQSIVAQLGRRLVVGFDFVPLWVPMVVVRKNLGESKSA